MRGLYLEVVRARVASQRQRRVRSASRRVGQVGRRRGVCLERRERRRGTVGDVVRPTVTLRGARNHTAWYPVWTQRTPRLSRSAAVDDAYDVTYRTQVVLTSRGSRNSHSRTSFIVYLTQVASCDFPSFSLLDVLCRAKGRPDCFWSQKRRRSRAVDDALCSLPHWRFVTILTHVTAASQGFLDRQTTFVKSDDSQTISEDRDDAREQPMM